MIKILKYEIVAVTIFAALFYVMFLYCVFVKHILSEFWLIPHSVSLSFAAYQYYKDWSWRMSMERKSYEYINLPR